MPVQITDIHLLPRSCGIYKVCNQAGEVLYIGQSKNIFERWKHGHHKLSEIIQLCGSNAFIGCIQVQEWLLNRAENAAISFYKPKLNSKKSPVV
jgi:excinuclease UvrABC nuclease subunit